MLALLLGAICFCALGVAVGSLIRSAEGASAVVNAIYLPVAFLAGAFFSPHAFPAFLRWIADVLPLTYFIRIVRGIMLHGHQIWAYPGSVAMLVAWGLVGAIVALRVVPLGTARAAEARLSAGQAGALRAAGAGRRQAEADERARHLLGAGDRRPRGRSRASRRPPRSRRAAGSP